MRCKGLPPPLWCLDILIIPCHSIQRYAGPPLLSQSFSTIQPPLTAQVQTQSFHNGPPSPTLSMRTKPSSTSLHSQQNHTPAPAQHSTAEYKTPTSDLPHQPKIFPGIVHERTRRNSVRQGSTSENDMEASIGNMRGLGGLSVREENEGEEGEDLL